MEDNIQPGYDDDDDDDDDDEENDCSGSHFCYSVGGVRGYCILEDGHEGLCFCGTCASNF